MSGLADGDHPDGLAATGDDRGGRHALDRAGDRPPAFAADRRCRGLNVRGCEQQVGVLEVEAVLLQVGQALGFVPLEDHAGARTSTKPSL